MQNYFVWEFYLSNKWISVFDSSKMLFLTIHNGIKLEFTTYLLLHVNVWKKCFCCGVIIWVYKFNLFANQLFYFHYINIKQASQSISPTFKCFHIRPTFSIFLKGWISLHVSKGFIYWFISNVCHTYKDSSGHDKWMHSLTSCLKSIQNVSPKTEFTPQPYKYVYCVCSLCVVIQISPRVSCHRF